MPRKLIRAKGFTLLEMMITVVVIGILASIAVPSYSDYVRRSALQDAFASMSDMRIKLEQFYQSNRNYGTNSCGHDGTQARVAFAASGGFTFACALGTGADADQTYTITATGGSGPASGHVFTLDSNNARRTTRFKGSTVAKACWTVKGNEC